MYRAHRRFIGPRPLLLYTPKLRILHPRNSFDVTIPTPTAGVMSPDLQPLVSRCSSHLCNPVVALFSGSLVSLLMVKKPCFAMWCRSYISSPSMLRYTFFHCMS